MSVPASSVSRCFSTIFFGRSLTWTSREVTPSDFLEASTSIESKQGLVSEGKFLRVVTIMQCWLRSLVIWVSYMMLVYIPAGVMSGRVLVTCSLPVKSLSA